MLVAPVREVTIEGATDFRSPDISHAGNRGWRGGLPEAGDECIGNVGASAEQATESRTRGQQARLLKEAAPIYSAYIRVIVIGQSVSGLL